MNRFPKRLAHPAAFAGSRTTAASSGAENRAFKGSRAEGGRQPVECPMTQECEGLQGPEPLRLPAVVGEGLVGLSHAVDVLFALVRAALIGLGVGELAGQPLGHRLLATRAGELDEPADGERARPAGGGL